MARAVKEFVPESVPLDLRTEADDIAARGMLSRLGGMATLYFRQGSAPEVRRAVNGILTDYLAAYGATISSYHGADERRLRRWDGRGLPQCYVDMAEATDPAARHYVKMEATGQGDSDPCFAMFWSHCASAEDERLFMPLSVIRLHLPPAALLEAADDLAARLADVSRAAGGDGAGGGAAVSAAVEPGVAVTPAGPALMLRAGPRPASGPAATGGIPEAYRQVARLIAPIRFEDYEFCVIRYPDHLAPDRGARREQTLRWLRRMDGGR